MTAEIILLVSAGAGIAVGYFFRLRWVAVASLIVIALAAWVVGSAGSGEPQAWASLACFVYGAPFLAATWITAGVKALTKRFKKNYVKRGF